MEIANPILAKAAILMRAKRKNYWDAHTYAIRLSKHRGKPEGGLWFRTRSCRYHSFGSCIMCDYGFGPSDTSAKEMIEFVRLGIDELPGDLYHLLVSPIGSFLDEWEVPVEARIGILKSMAETDIDTFAFESRVETITDEVITQCQSYLGRHGLKVYIGLETSNPWVSKYCINKTISMNAFETAIQRLNRQGVIASANILLGAPFLTQLETIKDVLKSTAWAFAKGTDECNLFPSHVKHGTLLHWLYEQGLYSPPSLWSLVEALRLLGREIVCNKIKFSWYKPYGSVNVLCSPTTCSLCESEVIHHLDQFYETNDYNWIEKLIAFKCRCKDVWKAELNAIPSESILERTNAAYELISSELLEDNSQYIKTFRREMFEDANSFLKLVPNSELLSF